MLSAISRLTALLLAALLLAAPAAAGEADPRWVFYTKDKTRYQSPCGTRLYSDRYAWVVSNDALGPAYGSNPVRLRNFDQEWDLVIGHTRKVFVEPGDRIKPGMKIARASDDGAPDGCHLHFEKRALKGGLSTATKPRRMLELKAKD